MKELVIKGQCGLSKILTGEKFENISKYLPAGDVVIITDVNVHRLYSNIFPSFPVISIGTGEEIKTLETVNHIFSQFLSLGVDRSWFVLGIGGGIVCDVAGYAASTYMRGLSFGFVSSTLLSQVDASVGGKNGVNFAGYKNLVGTINQPDFVICDASILKTLPEREIKCGFAEIIKHAVISGEEMFSFLENNADKAMKLDQSVIEKLISDSVVIKSEIVGRDELEKGERRILNLGHTFGHAIEINSDFNHGESVAAGLKMACDLSVKKGFLKEKTAERIINLLKKYNLPTEHKVEMSKLTSAIAKDKKRENSFVNFVFIRDVGDVFVEKIDLFP